MTIDIEILQFLHYHPLANRTEIMAGLTKAPSDSTMKRLLSAAVKEGNIETADVHLLRSTNLLHWLT